MDSLLHRRYECSTVVCVEKVAPRMISSRPFLLIWGNDG